MQSISSIPKASLQRMDELNMVPSIISFTGALNAAVGGNS